MMKSDQSDVIMWLWFCVISPIRY